MNAKRLLVAGAVAVVLGLPLALGVLSVISPPICDVKHGISADGIRTDGSFCLYPNPWTGRYIIDRTGKEMAWTMPPAPTVYPFWAEATIVVWLLLVGGTRLRSGRGIRELGLVSVVAVILAFPLALWALGVLAPPICPWFRNVCATADPWRGQYGYPPSLGVVGSPWLDTPTPPSFLLLWAAAAAAIWLLLWVVAWVRRRA